ncbi:Protein NEOXANTHIN-DEFICIENT 1 [Bienertia sinuspersici]
MEPVEKTKNCTGYGKPPWRFKGRALYQFHLVKSDVARALIPKEFRLVEAFGYTLGGFFLANYDHSPAGVFDELVVIAGIVWNPPTSCAWASKVLVNSNEACTTKPSSRSQLHTEVTEINGSADPARSFSLNLQNSVVVQNTIPIFSSILAKWSAGCVFYSHFKYLGRLLQQISGVNGLLKILQFRLWRKLKIKEAI